MNRRTVLRGLGGLTLALPALEIMRSSHASADVGDPPPKRFVISFGGMSIGADGTDYDLVTPDIVGTDYDCKRGLQSLMDVGVRDEVSIVSGLELPWGEAGNIPPAGRSVYYHYNTVGPQLAGTSTTDERDGQPRGPTADQVVADALALDEEHRVLTYRIQVGTYINYNGSDNTTEGGSMTLSWRDVDGQLQAQTPTFSPKVAYENLFLNFLPDDPEEKAKALFLLERRKSVIDLVHTSFTRLLPRLGKNDKVRLEQHFDEIRGLEKRLAALQPSGGACELLPHPGDDPPIGGSSLIYTEGCNADYIQDAGYSNEDLRGDLFTDYICMAFACDMYRVASLMVTEWKTYMNMYQIAGWQSDIHGLTHMPSVEGVADAVNFHVLHLARLAKKLRDTPDVDGTHLIDHTAAVLLFEGGWGYDPEGQSDLSSHSTENMVALIAGRAGGLVPGQHIQGNGRHPVNVVISAMNACGVDGLGEVTENIPELFG